jgi:hypothetical protein
MLVCEMDACKRHTLIREVRLQEGYSVRDIVTPAIGNEEASSNNTRNRDEYAMAAARRRLATLKTASWRSGASPDRGVDIPHGLVGLG